MREEIKEEFLPKKLTGGLYIPTPEELEKIKQKRRKKDKSKKNRKTILINTTKAKGATTLLEFLMKKNKWKCCRNLNADILWTGNMLKADNMDLAYVIRINRFPGLKELC